MNSSNYFIKYLNRIFDQIISFDNEINHILKNKKNKIFLKNYFELLYSNKNIHNFLSQKLLKWLRNEISGISIFNKLNKKKFNFNKFRRYQSKTIKIKLFKFQNEKN